MGLRYELCALGFGGFVHDRSVDNHDSSHRGPSQLNAITQTIPAIVQQRAWEAAYALQQDYVGELDEDQVALVAACMMAGADRMTWEAAALVFDLYLATAGIRR